MSDGTLVSDALIANVQRKLRAGNNITITSDNYGPIISATDTTYDAGDGISISGSTISVNKGDSLVFANGKLGVNYNLVQQKLAEGTGISITGATISVDTSAIQEKLTAGQNIQITNNTISATDTTYSAGQNITIDSNNVISAAGDSVYEIIYHNVTGKVDATYSDVETIIQNNKIPILLETNTTSTSGLNGYYQYAGREVRTEQGVDVPYHNFVHFFTSGRDTGVARYGVCQSG